MLRLRDISCAFGDQVVLRDIDLIVESGEILCLLGPSGCGKTTLLRIIAGLEEDFHGAVCLEGQNINAVPVHERGFGLMFQDYALFPHMNVAENVAFGLRMRGNSAKARGERVREVLDLVGLSGFEQRDVGLLSGGEQQRVALARSLAPNPRFLMLDEPLGSLDAALRDRLIPELRSIIKQLQLTAMYVTHDQNEAYAIADRIAIMNAGKIEQVGEPEALYHSPRTAFVARFLGLSNVIETTRKCPDFVETPIGRFEIEGEPDAILIHPTGIHLANSSTTIAIDGIVRERLFMGDRYRLKADVGDKRLLMFWLPGDCSDLPEHGDEVVMRIDSRAVIGLYESA